MSMYLLGFLLYQNEKNSLSDLKPESSIFSCILTDYPEEKENSFLLKVKLQYKKDSAGTENVKGSLLLYSKKDLFIKKLLPGDLLAVQCTPVKIVNRGNPYEFNYKFFMENQGIKFFAFTSGNDISIIRQPEKRKLVHKALIIREKIIDMYKNRGITGNNLAIVSAVILGQKNMLDPEQKQNFIRAGVMHIMAVSGLHAVILSMFVFSLLFFLKGKYNIIRVVITILFLWSFAFVTGLTPSVMRATIMFTFIQAGTLMKRKVNGINSVLASAFVLILIRPSVIFNAGFLLSYSAVIYIICFYREFYQKLLFKGWLNDKIWQSMVVTIVAQAGTLPLTIMLFNRFPAYFILTNVIIVPLSSLLIIVGCIVPIVYPVQIISLLIAKVLNFLTSLTEKLTAIAADLPGSGIENIGMTNVQCILLTLTIFLGTYYLMNRQKLSVRYPVVFFLIFISTGTVSEIIVRRSNELIVYNTPGSTTIGIRTGKILNIYSDTSLVRPEILKHSSTLGLRIRTNILQEKTYSIDAGKKILISNSLNNGLLQRYKPEIILLTGPKPDLGLNSLQADFHLNIILTSEVSTGYRIPERSNVVAADTVHYVRKSGAYVKSI
jgi:competence protein ComEC